MHHGLKRDATGVHNVEGNVAGPRAAAMAQARETEQAEYEAKKQKIQQNHARGVGRIDEKFDRTALTADSVFQKKTVGLVTAADFRKLQEQVTRGEEQEEATEKTAEEKLEEEASLKRQAAAKAALAAVAKKKAAVARKAVLSFAHDDEEEEEEEEEEELIMTKKSQLKNPGVDTTFLPDRDREAVMEGKRAELKAEWEALQEAVKQERVEVPFAYYDGSSHRRKHITRKGQTIGAFVGEAQKQLSAEFPELRGTSSDSIMFVKEDLIIPHQNTFYDLIMAKARGKTAQLFDFDDDTPRNKERSKLLSIFDGVNTVQAPDATNAAAPEEDLIIIDHSKPGKVVTRVWYERNKHIFPADRWEIYDPTIDYATHNPMKADNPNSYR